MGECERFVKAFSQKFIDLRWGLGYTVRVTYRYHGQRTYLFATDEEKLGLVSHAQAYTKAMRFHDKIQKQIKQGIQK